MSRRIHRIWLLPAVTLGLALVVVATTRVEQEGQYKALGELFERHARFAGHLVRESAQEAALATSMIYDASLEKGLRTLALLGVPGPDEDCDALARRLPDVLLWATMDAHGVHGCMATDESADPAGLIGRILTSPAEDILDDATMRALGVFCVHDPKTAPRTALCLDRRDLDAMRLEVGLGPLLASLKGLDLHYLVVQDEHGVLAASPNPGRVSGFVEDPTLGRVQAGGEAAVQARLLEADARPVFEVVAPLGLADGSRAVVRIALDAGELARLRAMIDRRMTAMAGGLGAAVLLSVALAWVLSRGALRREEFAEQIRRQEQETRHWQSVGQMSAMVAHEVRNPLNTISMALQRLDREVRAAPGDVPVFREMLHLATDASERVERVVKDFLELGRPLELDVQPYSLEVLLREVAAPLQMRAQANNVTLAVSCPGGVEIRADRHRFEQALANLVNNALDASPAGTTVTFRGGRDASGVWVAVQDRGPGMDEDTLARVQEPFYTTRATGSGLGLPMARRVAEAHGGRLTLMSAPGRGTIATVSLPDATG